MTGTIVTATFVIALYVVSASLIGFRLLRNATGGTITKSPALMIGGVALVLHAALLYQAIVTAGGFNLGFFHAFSLIAWLIVALLFVISTTKPMENLGLILLPFAALTVLLSVLFPSEHVIASTAPWELRAHILLSVMAYSLLTLGAVQALLLYFQEYHLRNRKPTGVIRALPPLQVMEALLFQILSVGFIFLTLALSSGIIFLEDIFAQHLVHKTVLSIGAWCVFGALLWGRFKYGWRGRTAIRWTFAGFVVLVLAYFGSKFVLELVLTNPSA